VTLPFDRLVSATCRQIFGARRWILLCLIGCSVGCSEQPGSGQFSGPTMGTVYAIAWHDVAGGRRCEVSQAQVAELLLQINAAMSTYQPDSELSRLNQTPAGRWVDLSPELAEVLSAAQTIWLQSAGAFDVTVGPLVNLWGFGPDSGVIRPSQEQQQRAGETVGMDKLEFVGSRLRKQHADLYIDLSALAKGYAVDLVAQLMSQQGCDHFMVDIGGEIRTKGSNRRGKSWQIGIEVPDPGQLGTLHTVLGLSDLSIATSGDYRNFRLVDGERVDHVIDPRTGLPATNTVVSATVLHPSAMWADAYATVLMVLGVEEGLAFADKQGFPAYVMYRTSMSDDPQTFSFAARYNNQMAGFLPTTD
jgi:FAD:protein FMN transferase